MSYQLQEINRRIDQDVNGFLEECDAQYAEKVSQAADAILANLPLSPIVLLSGPSGSGKTTTALKIEEELERRGVLSHTISLDNYFKTLNPKTVPRTADGSIDFESPKCLDMDLLNAHFSKLSKGETIVVPHFEFARQMRNDSRGTLLKLDKNEIAIFEGIHALNDIIVGKNPHAFKLYIQNENRVDDDATFTIGEKGVVIKPVKNERNIVTWENADGPVASMTFLADSDADSYCPRLSTRWNDADYLDYFHDVDAYLFDFVDNPRVPAATRPTLSLCNPFVDEDGDLATA